MPDLCMNPQISICLDSAEVEAFLERMKAVVSPADYDLIKGMADTLRFVVSMLQAANTSIKRLKEMVFGPTTEKTKDVLKDSPDSQSEETGAGVSPETEPETGEEPEPVKEKRKGHGRNGRDDYPGAKRTSVPHESLEHGDRCPLCKRGRVYHQKEPGIIIILRGQAPIGAEIFESEKLRCNGCGEVFEAKLPEGVGEKKYDPTAGSMMALMKYGNGFPFYRFEKLQESLGIPLPGSTMWEVLEGVAQVVEPVFFELVRLAAQGEVLYTDDTVMKILGLSKELLQLSYSERKLLTAGDEKEEEEAENDEAKRKGVFTSAIVSEVEEHQIALFFTGKKHAGENMDRVLAEREKGREPPIEMSDGLNRNVPKKAEVISANCLIHGRRNFVKLVDNFPRECRFMIECVKAVYEVDGEAKDLGLSKEERLRLHQEKSGIVMEALHEWLLWKIEAKLVEPNSTLGLAIEYMLKRWEPLTLFLRKAGAPIDNNLAERILKMAILLRKNSYFYKTENGARVGDRFMTLIYTCRLEGVNPFEYLTALQRNAERVRANPRDWLPWNYKATLLALEGGNTS